jgi:hypothetical protein
MEQRLPDTPMPNTKNRTTADLRTVRDLLNQAARPDLMPRTAVLFRLAALALGGEVLSDTLHPLTPRQVGAVAALLDLAPTDEAIEAMFAQRGCA